MLIENSEALKTWLISNLSRICNADPAALAKYVLALVKKDKTENDLREFCSDQLEVFLLKETRSFVDLLFETLRNKSYLSSSSDASAGNKVVNASLNTTVVEAASEQNKNVTIENEKEIPSLQQSTSPVKSNLLGNKNRDVDPRKRHVEDDRNKDNFSKKPKVRKYDHYSKFYKDVRDKDDRRDKYFKERDSNHSGRKDFSHRSRSNTPDGGRSRGSSRSRSTSRSRSRSNERAGRSETKNLPKSHINKPDHGDKDYRQKMPSVLKPVQQVPKSFVDKRPMRCIDYDEKGYCMRGEMCLYDHGADPILVEDVSVLNFGVPVSDVTSRDGNPSKLVLPDGKVCTKSPLPPLPSSSPPPLPPPPPPLPPLPPSYMPEPYNPEAPGMNLSPRDHLNYWPPPVHHMPPPPHIPPMPPANMPNMMFNINEPPPFHSSKPIRTRELIGVPTIGNSEFHKNIVEEKLPQNANVYSLPEKEKADTDERKKGFDFARLGPMPRNNRPQSKPGNRTTLEVRKIPKNLNTITNLNDHFSKFGRIVNLQVGIEMDPEAALVQFMTNSEATAAYRSTDAILNNRFIKVFWHNKNERNNHTIDIKNSSNSVENNLKPADKNNEFSFDSRNVVYSKNDVLKNNNSEKISEKVMGNLTAKVNLPRAVYTTGSLKKTFSGIRPVTVKQKEEMRKGTLQKKMELHRKKQELLASEIQHQKMLLEKLSKSKTDKEKEFLKESLKARTELVSRLQDEIKKESENMKSLLKTNLNQTPLSKSEAEKELLDAEMDLYNKQHSGDDTADLLLKVNELKQKAKALGLIDNFSHGPMVQQTRPPKAKFVPKVPNLKRSIDRRPRKIIVIGAPDKFSLFKHFSQFGQVESVKEVGSGFVAMFSTRLEAEGAFSLGSKMGDITLSLSWITDIQTNIENTAQIDSVDLKADTSQLLEVDEDDEEEDNEDRSWRR